MRKKVTERRSKEQRFREIEDALQQAGQGGLRVAAVAKAIGKSKSYTHKLLLEMADSRLIEREITYVDSANFYVNYVYYQLPLWDALPRGNDWDGITGECSNCGKDLVGERGMCSSCRQVYNG